MNPLAILKLLWDYRKDLAYGLLAAALVIGALTYRHHLIAAGEDTGRAQIRALWQADTRARDLVTAEAIANAKARETAAIANNTEVLRDYNQKLVEIAADNTSLAGRVRDYQNRLRNAAAGQATDQLGIAVASGIASRAAELDAAYDRYDKACQRDATKLDKLIAEVKPQL